jgi:hypothetical protein
MTLMRVVRTERNWTNYYHATQAQFEFILNDPLFPAEMHEMRQYQLENYRRRSEDELPGPTSCVNLVADCVPDVWRELPLINQPRRWALEERL